MNRREFIRNLTMATAGSAVIGTTGLADQGQADNIKGNNGKMKILVLTGSPRKGKIIIHTNGKCRYASTKVRTTDENGTSKPRSTR